MPIYEYRCRDCAQLFEEWQKGCEQREISCPVCGGRSERFVSDTASIFREGSWQAADYCNKGDAANFEADDAVVNSDDTASGLDAKGSAAPTGGPA
jgi:putative FmdB family regulatory protein